VVKGRPAAHPLIVHLDNIRYLHRWVRDVPAVAEKLAARFWPGPMTLVLPRAPNVLDIVTGGLETVAIRVPAHPMAQQLLTAFGGGIAAPSANRYGHISPTRAEHVREELGDAVKIVLDGGECQIGVESTILACVGDRVQLLRPGSITQSQIRAVVGDAVAGPDASAPRVPGSSASHYAPATPLEIVPGEALETLAGAFNDRGERIAVLALRLPLKTLTRATWINAGRRPQQYAHDLYAHLRTLDKAGCIKILAQELPEDERWDAVRDRLQKAATRPAEEGGFDLVSSAGVLP
jgi:L-threonylcarbamoyladenylate synthase